MNDFEYRLLDYLKRVYLKTVVPMRSGEAMLWGEIDRLCNFI